MEKENQDRSPGINKLIEGNMLRDIDLPTGS